MPEAVAYKILTNDELAVLERDGRFDGAPIDLQDGFVHLSTAAQLRETVDRHFAGRDDLSVVAVDVDALGGSVRWEPSRGGRLFPHLYGPMTLDTVLAYAPLEREADGSIKLPVAG